MLEPEFVEKAFYARGLFLSLGALLQGLRALHNTGKVRIPSTSGRSHDSRDIFLTAWAQGLVQEFMRLVRSRMVRIRVS